MIKKKYLVDTLTLSSDTANGTWQKKVEYHCYTALNVNMFKRGHRSKFKG